MCNVGADRWVAMYLCKELFLGLWSLRMAVEIALKDNHKPFALTVPRKHQEATIERGVAMHKKLGIIQKVGGPTQWCLTCLIVPRPNGKIRFYIDFTKPGDMTSVSPIASTEGALVELGYSKTWAKLNANCSYRQMPLKGMSRKLTTHNFVWCILLPQIYPEVF